MGKTGDVMLKHPEERKQLEYVFDRESPDGAQKVMEEQTAMPAPDGAGIVKARKVWTAPRMYIIRS